MKNQTDDKYPYVVSTTDDKGKPLKKIIHRSLNPMCSTPLMDMEAKDKLKYGSKSAYRKDMNSVSFEKNKLKKMATK